MPGFKCIYCCEEKGEEDFQHTEHVMPQAFGVFENNLTLNKIVCDGCNQYFGDYLEIFLARDTFEGVVLRYRYGIKKARDAQFIKKRVRFRLHEPGPWKGALVEEKYSEELDDVVVEQLAQVGFRKKGTQEYAFFLTSELPKKEELPQFDYVQIHDLKNMRFREKYLLANRFRLFYTQMRKTAHIYAILSVPIFYGIPDRRGFIRDWKIIGTINIDTSSPSFAAYLGDPSLSTFLLCRSKLCASLW